jgi:hypothetical protein
MIRVLRVARCGAMKARIQAELDAVITSAPESVRGPLRKLTSRQRIRVCAALRPGTQADPATATTTALRFLDRRWQALQAEIAPRRRPRRQERLVAYRPGAHALPPEDQGLRSAPHGRGQDKDRDPAGCLQRYIAREIYPLLAG